MRRSSRMSHSGCWRSRRAGHPPEWPGTARSSTSAAARERLLADATLLEVPAGQAIFRSADPGRRLGVVLTGLARAFLAAPDGRQVTVRYAGAGRLITSGFVVTRAPLTVAAVTDCT